jgi:hypothetical protein
VPIATVFKEASVMSGKMPYKAEDLPGEVASALPSFAAVVLGSASVLSDNELVVARDDKDRYLLGIAPRGTRASEVPRSVFSAMVQGGAAVPARLADDVTLKLVRVVRGDVARAIAVALPEHRKTAPGAPFANVGWRASDDVVVVMVVPPVAPEEKGLVIGGETSLGRELHYHVDTKTFTVVRVTGAR